ncbi:MAG: S41 family peptidase [Thermoguttaceae bacterium]|nr:S41 family peptidase [Thermoguttaceae bacterium]
MTWRHYFCFVLVVLLAGLAARFSPDERLLSSVINSVQRDSLEEVSSRELVEGAISGLLERSPYYPYTVYVPPEEQKEFEDEMEGVFSGIGIHNMAVDEASGELWFSPFYGSPAWEVGLRFGDRIVAVEGEKAEGHTLYEIVSLIHGEEGTPVSLTVRSRASIVSAYHVPDAGPGSPSGTENDAEPADRPEGENGGEPGAVREVSITRSAVHESTLSGFRRGEDGEWIWTLDDHPEIGYVHLEQFNEEAPALWEKAFEELEKKGISALILDLRGNPGGLLEDAVSLSSCFLPEGEEISTVRRRGGVVEDRLESKGGKKYDWPIAVLIDHDSASASEMVSGALADHHRATLVGTRSYGKGTVQKIIELPRNLGLIRLTSASFFRPNGEPFHRMQDADEDDVWGISPDPENLIEPDDYQMNAAALFADLRSYPPAEDDPPAGDLVRLIFDRARKRDLIRGDEGEVIAETECDFATPSTADPQFQRALEILLAGEGDQSEKSEGDAP